MLKSDDTVTMRNLAAHNVAGARSHPDTVWRGVTFRVIDVKAQCAGELVMRSRDHMAS